MRHSVQFEHAAVSEAVTARQQPHQFICIAVAYKKISIVVGRMHFTNVKSLEYAATIHVKRDQQQSQVLVILTVIK